MSPADSSGIRRIPGVSGGEGGGVYSPRMHDIFEVGICFSLFLSDLASSAHADINSDSTVTSCQLASSGEQIFICVTVAFAFVLIYCQI